MFSFCAGKVFLISITVAQTLLSKNFQRGRVTWGTFLGLWYGRVLGSHGGSWMVEDDGPGVMSEASAA